MNKIIFINPSPNIRRLFPLIKSQSMEPVEIYTNDYTQNKPENLRVCNSGIFSVLPSTHAADMAEPLLYSLKKPFFTYFKSKYIKEKLLNINQNLENASFQDYILLTGSLWQDKSKVSAGTHTFDEIVSMYPLSKIVTGSIPVNSGKTYITRWKTDYDIKEVFLNDYFFIYDSRGRHEIYKDGNILVTISECKPRLDWIRSLNPSFMRFAFEKEKVTSTLQNRNNWIIKHTSRIYLINDYSWQGISVKLPDTWAKTLSKYLCSDKKK